MQQSDTLNDMYAKELCPYGVILAIVVLIFPLTTCSQSHPIDQTLRGISPSNDAKPRVNVTDLCSHIHDIKLIPFHAEKGRDAAYDTFIDAGGSAVPCLIQKITDTTKMADPRETIKSPDTTVGDVAYFLLIDITKVDFDYFLPPNVQEAYKTEGVFAYYRYVQKKTNREQLQRRVSDWYRVKSL